MSDASATVVSAWAAEWADEFDQALDETFMQSYVGHRVAGEHEKEGQVPKRFVRNIIGYSKMVVFVKDLAVEGYESSAVERWGLIDDEGKMLSIYNGMDLQIVGDDVDEEG